MRVTSTDTPSAFPPAARISAAARSATSCRRPATTTRAPAWARPPAIPLPSPVPPPVTTATLPLRSNGFVTIGPPLRLDEMHGCSDCSAHIKKGGVRPAFFPRGGPDLRCGNCFVGNTFSRQRLAGPTREAIVGSSRASPDPLVNSCPCRDGRDPVETLPLPATRSRPSCIFWGRPRGPSAGDTSRIIAISCLTAPSSLL